jgi:hypothetical protein
MAILPTEGRREKSLDQFPRFSTADDLAAETDQVKIVILDALVRRKCFVNETRANAREFVSRHAGPYSAATNRNAAIHLSGGNSAGQRKHKIRIVIVRLQTVRAEIDHVVARFAQKYDELLFQFKATVIRGDPYDLG